MMKTLLTLAFTLVLLALQAALLRYVGGGAFSLALAMPVLVWLGLHAENVEGAVGAAGVGYLLDAMTGAPRGLMVFLSMALFLGARLAGATVDLRGRAAFAVLTGAGTFLFDVAALLLTRYVSAPEAAPGARLLGRMLLEAFLTAVLSPLVGAAMRRINAMFQREEPGLLG